MLAKWPFYPAKRCTWNENSPIRKKGSNWSPISSSVKDLLRFLSGGLSEGAISAGAHADLDHFAIDLDFILLEIDVPASSGGT